VTGRRERRRRKLLGYLKERRGYSHLKEEALDRTMWRFRFGTGFAPVVRQTIKWMNIGQLVRKRNRGTQDMYTNSQMALLRHNLLYLLVKGNFLKSYQCCFRKLNLKTYGSKSPTVWWGRASSPDFQVVQPLAFAEDW